MKAYHDFRLFYNQSIHPELMYLENQRIGVVRRIYLCSFVALLLVLFAYLADIFLLSLFVLIGIGVMLSTLINEVRLYFQSFKPRVVTALLDFFDNGVNFSELVFAERGHIDRKVFLKSGLYICSAETFLAEDFIQGKIREMPFEMCELRVQDISPVRSGLENVFSGVFIVADYLRPDMRGSIFIMPDVFRKHQAQSTRAAHLAHAKRVNNQLLDEFESIFDTYATPDMRPTDTISIPFQMALIEFYRTTKRNVSLSIIDSKLYIAMQQEEDLLEPKLWRSNVGYQQICDYHIDLQRLFSMIQAMDVLN
jgi:Protein of unknown function (DUF3137)